MTALYYTLSALGFFIAISAIVGVLTNPSPDWLTFSFQCLTVYAGYRIVKFAERYRKGD